MDKEYINDFFETLKDIRNVSSPDMKQHFDACMEDFCRSVLGRELRQPSKIADMSAEQREKVREQNRVRQERARQRKADGLKGP